MKRFIFSLAMSLCATAANAESNHCSALYERLKAKTTGNPGNCVAVIDEPQAPTQCTSPFATNKELPKSRLVMILDASGSMAGQVDGKSKMSVAKTAALDFLSQTATQMPVGLVVYGHKGNNKESGKEESCAGIEWAHPIARGGSGVKSGISALQPTGWTPMAATLQFVEQELTKGKLKEEGTTQAPIIYLVSDGEETCGGDPVAAAESLAASGVKAVINVIGFDVDGEAKSQLEAISAAGNGAFYLAKNSSELNKYFQDARAAQASEAAFVSCVSANKMKAMAPYLKASQQVFLCGKKETEQKIRDVILQELQKVTSPEDLACQSELQNKARMDAIQAAVPVNQIYTDLMNKMTAAGEASEKSSIENALPPVR